MEAKRESKLARDEILALRAMAPIAGQFEECVQVFDKLSSALEACRRGIEEWFNKKQHVGAKHQLKETLTLLDEAVTKFKTWDRDLSASSRALDHALRGSSQMSKITVGHLQELHEVIVKGLFHYITDYTQKLSLCQASRQSLPGTGIFLLSQIFCLSQLRMIPA
jgi:hypothetical protein